MKEMVKIFLIALPFSWFATIMLPFLHQLGFGVWLVESLSIRGYWPVSIAFYIEDFLSALITSIPYVGLLYLATRTSRSLDITTIILAYMLFTFLLCFQKESLTACLFTLVQSANIAIYAAIVLLFAMLNNIFGKSKSAR